jgi:hypothetical protein
VRNEKGYLGSVATNVSLSPLLKNTIGFEVLTVVADSAGESSM